MWENLLLVRISEISKHLSSSKKNFQKKKQNQKVENIVATEVTVSSPFITLSSQNHQNFLDIEAYNKMWIEVKRFRWLGGNQVNQIDKK